jgi:hypothetical protein
MLILTADAETFPVADAIACLVLDETLAVEARPLPPRRNPPSHRLAVL